MIKYNKKPKNISFATIKKEIVKPPLQTMATGKSCYELNDDKGKNTKMEVENAGNCDWFWRK